MTHPDTALPTASPASSPAPERPSPTLLAAAFAGFGLVASGCPSDPSAEPDPCPDMTDSVGGTTTGGPSTVSATTSEPGESSTGAPPTTDDPSSSTSLTTGPVDPSTTTDDTDDTDDTTGTTGEPAGCAPPEVLSEVETNKQTFAEYTADCDALGGYVQIHASCSGVNSCAGFSVGDWNPDVRSDHTCRGLNGCAGLSCITTPPDSGLTGEQILALEAIPNGQPDDVINGPAPCSYCHAVWTDDVVDFSVFKVHVLPGSGRTADNWLDRTPAEMERIVAFGSHGVTPDGIAYASMVGYAKSLSRAEIERVVEHIRTLPPVVQEIKFDEP